MMDRFVALDFETLDTWRGSVISVGCVVFEGGEDVVEYYSLICPPSKSENWYCCETHGLHYDDVKDSPSFPDVWEKVDSIIGDSPVVAHNAGFERSCINECSDFFSTKNTYKYIDTLAMSRTLLPHLNNHKLDTVCNELGIRLPHHHNALDDARACGEIYAILREKKHG